VRASTAPRGLLHMPASVEQSTEGEARPAVGRALSLVTLPTRSRRQEDSDLLTCVAKNDPWDAGDDGAAWLTSGDGEGALRWSSGSGNGFGNGGGDWRSFSE
jgi:hypothetical protein